MLSLFRPQKRWLNLIKQLESRSRAEKVSLESVDCRCVREGEAYALRNQH